MISLSAYASAPVSGAGVRAILGNDQSIFVTGTFTCLDQLESHVTDAERNGAPPRVVLLELSASLTLTRLKKIAGVDAQTWIVLWFDTASGEYLSQAIAAGARGLLSKNSPIETHIECLKAVAQGYSWLDVEAKKKLMSTRRVALAPRERHVTGLIAQGLSNKEIAWSLGITEGTVKVYLSKLFDKVGVSDRFELALLALKNMNADHSADTTLPRELDGDKVKPLSVPPFLSLERRQSALARPGNLIDANP